MFRRPCLARVYFLRRQAMTKRLLSTLLSSVAISALLVAVPVAHAGTGGTDTISIHFGADEPTQAGGSFLAPTDVTGVVSSANWNNEVTNAGVDTAVMEDVNGTVASTSTTVIWYAS